MGCNVWVTVLAGVGSQWVTMDWIAVVAEGGSQWVAIVGWQFYVGVGRDGSQWLGGIFSLGGSQWVAAVGWRFWLGVGRNGSQWLGGRFRWE